MQILKFTYKILPSWIQWISQLVPDKRIEAMCTYSIEQVFFCALMVPLLRFRSLRSFCIENRDNAATIFNFGRYISITEIPSDDTIRMVLKDVQTESLNTFLNKIHHKIERNKILKNHKLLDKFELLAIDGTGQLCSYEIKCKKCLTRKPKNDEIQYLHGQLLVSLTNPLGEYALPLFYEPIENCGEQTEYVKNDCEISAAKRMLVELKKFYPKRNFCFLGDNLYASSTIVDLIYSKGWHFIFTAKAEKNRELFSWYDSMPAKKNHFEFIDKNGVIYKYTWLNKLPIKQYHNYENATFVNLLEFEEISLDGEVLYYNTWITDIVINSDNVKQITQGGRARFTIENRNFNEQKNRGYGTDHNFGHFGNLPNIFFGLAQIANLIVQLFSFWREAKKTIELAGSTRRYFERLAVIISSGFLPDDNAPILYLKFEFNST